jgi:hypothetical protein
MTREKKKNPGKRNNSKKKIHAAALILLRDWSFLFRVVQKIGSMGIVGEKCNRLILFLAGITRVFPKPVSVLEKGASSTGKSELMKADIALFPPECVLTRSSLSGKAPAHSSDELSGKLLYITEYRGVKDARYFTRLLQSEGEIAHEYATVVGSDRGTAVASRKGSPVIMTTTTDDRIFEDDETRFLSIQADDSPQQTHNVIAAHFTSTPVRNDDKDLRVWHEAVRILCKKVPRFRHPPWFTLLADEIPSDEPRARRDAVRFLSLLKAVSLCRSHSDGRFKACSKEIEVNFADYCVAYHILCRAFTSTFAGAHPQALKLARAVRRLKRSLGRPVTIKEAAQHLGWSQAVVYKFVKKAEKEKLVQYESGSHLWNRKRLLPGMVSRPSFLPDPQLILQKCREIGDEVRYSHPLTGKEVIRRRGENGFSKGEAPI